jgi:hypothetical protein
MLAFALNGCKQRPFISDMIRRLILLPRPAIPCLRPTFFANCLGLILLCAPPLLAKEAPRYLFFNIAPESGWNQNHPDSFSRALFFSDCRFICVYNWNLGMFEKTTAGQEAVRKLVAEWRE